MLDSEETKLKIFKKECFKFINDRWNDFIQNENGEYYLKDIYFFKKEDLFIFVCDKGKILKFRMNKENKLRNKLKRISIKR